MGKSYTNIAGGEFKPWVDKQIKLRQQKLASEQRDEQTLNFSTNRNAWYRVTSMSVIKDNHPLIKKYGPTIKGDGLAKEFILQGGVIKRDSKNKIKLRRGITRGADTTYIDDNGKKVASSTNFGDGSYGAIDVSELGYKPMPGITDFSIGTGGKLGVLQEVKLSFKCHNLAQLEIIDTLYMKLGFSVFVEFGHTNYFTNDGKFERNPMPLDPWLYKEKQALLKAIQDKKIQESGNWGGLFGTVKNFNWTINKDGSYDCNIEVVGAGDILESLRSNQNSEKASGISLGDSVADQSEDNVVARDAKDTGGWGSDQTEYLPSVVSARYSSIFENIMYALYEYGLVNYEDQYTSVGASKPPNVIKTTGGGKKSKGYIALLNEIFGGGKGGSPYNFIQFSNSGNLMSATKRMQRDRYFANRGNSYQVMRHHLDGDDAIEPAEVRPYLFNLYTAAFNPAGENAEAIDATEDFDDSGKPQVYITLGHLLAIMNVHCNLFYGPSKKKASPYIMMDFHPDYTFCNVADTQFSIDPMVCLIPFRDDGGLVSTAFGQQVRQSFEDGGYISDAFVAAELQVAGESSWDLLGNTSLINTIRNPIKAANSATALVGRILGNENQKKARKVVRATQDLNNIKAIEEDNVNKVTAVLNPNAPFFDADNPKRGKLMEVLVNVNFVTSTLSRLKGSKDNSVSTAQLLDEILKGITKNIGGVNDFRLYPDDETNVLRILDDKVIEPSKTKYTELKIFGLGNTIYDYSYSSKISNELAAQIVVASQAQPEGVNEDDFAFSHLAQGLEDRIQPVKITQDTTEEGTSSITEDPTGESPLTHLVDFLRQTYCVMHYSSTDVSSAGDTARKFFNQRLSIDPSKRGQTLIPLDFSLTMDGLTGLIPHQAFIIDKNRLPSTYRIGGNGDPRIAFILHSILHNFDGNKWTTTIKGQTLNIDFEGRNIDQKAFDEQQQKSKEISNPPNK